MQQFARLLFTPFRALTTHHHRNQPPLAVNAGSNKVKTRPGGVASFQTVDVERLIPQQAVTVLLGDAVPGEALLAIHVVELGLTVNDGSGEYGQIVG